MVASLPSGGLPAPRSSLIGRDQDVATLHDLVLHADERVLTLTGVGGCGKTRVAVQVAADLAPDFPGRIWFVELAALADPALLLLTVAAALGVQEVATLEAVVDVLGPQPALLVLDNCEHLIDACATLVDDLLATCPTLRILATSREPLQVPGERQFRLSPLALPAQDGRPGVDAPANSPAVQLFVARAQAVAPQVRLTADNAEIVTRICTRLDGIPLAIELAAARARVLSLEQILARLDDSFRVLTGGSRVAPTRQQTLRAALDWSDALLTDGERTLFQRLAVFAGAFQLDAVEAVCTDDTLPLADILDGLTRLVDKSLVTVTQDDRNAWYRLLEPVRQYALRGLTASGVLPDIQARHAGFYLSLAEQGAPTMYAPVPDIWLARLEREQGNLRATLRWAHDAGKRAIELRLATALVPFWEAHGHLAEGRGWLQVALEAPFDAVEPALRMRALAGAGRLTHLLCAYPEAEQLHTESLAIARELDDRPGIAMALTELGMVMRLRLDFANAVRYVEEGLALHRELGDRAGVAVALLNLGASYGDECIWHRSIPYLNEGLALFEALGDARHTAIARSLLGCAMHESGDSAQAGPFLAASFTEHARLGGRWFVTYNLMVLVKILMTAGRWEAAARMLGAAQAIGDSVSGQFGTSTAEQLGVSICSHLDQTSYTAAWTAGHGLTFDQAVAEGIALATTGSPAPAAARPSPFDGAPLTRREREVAALLARGLTDRQIADELFITVGTAGVHVHHILAKLDLYSRVQVADWLAGQPTTDTTD